MGRRNNIIYFRTCERSSSKMCVRIKAWLRHEIERINIILFKYFVDDVINDPDTKKGSN